MILGKRFDKEEPPPKTNTKAFEGHFGDALRANCNYSFYIDLTDNRLEEDFEIRDMGPASAVIDTKIPCNYDDFVKRLVDIFDAQVREMSFSIDGARPFSSFLSTHNKYSGVTSDDLLRVYKKGNRHVEIELHNKILKRYIKLFILFCEDERAHVMATVFAYDITNQRLEEIKQHEDTLRANEYLHSQMRIVRSFSSIYFATWSVDLTKNLISPIAIPQWLDCVATETKGNAKKAFVYFINKFITKSASSREKMLEFLNIDAVSYNMTGESLLTCEYFGDTFGWVSANLIKVSQNEFGECTQVIYALRNIDSQKQRELKADAALKEAMAASERANQAKSTFLSRMSHDIRTPMNAIIGMTQIAAVYIDDKKRLEDCLDKITVSSKHLLELINEVLDMSRIESGKVQLTESCFDFTRFLDELLVILNPLAAEKHHTLTIDRSAIVHKNVIGDELRLQRIFVNIISNSIKYTHQGGIIRVKIDERKTSTRGISCFEIIFSDNGIGMSEDFVKKVFDPFSREVISGTVKDPDDAKIEGTGLGMSIVKNLVLMMGGNIKVESKLGEGSKFSVTIYLKVEEGEEADNCPCKGGETPSLKSELKDIDYEGKRVLLVEDNLLNSEIACEILAMMNLKVDTASSGEEAIKRLKEMEAGYYALVFMDIQMPGMSGYDAARAIRSCDREDLKSIPIIAMTANAFTEDVIAAKVSGMNAHITKPLDIAKLKETIREWI